ncbi:MerR family transcriptional regulator [Streptomyces subrutilus]|uniref:MerR family transcriptional regulator n=1 Tax=Streptomyces subrutilus TaxID=36818 RepID=UPI002E1678B1|nr:helix-turn-helix domain-containing protein [Streptomyces subrutilus]
MNTTTAAAEARVTVATIRHWARRGVVAATKTAGRWVIDTASLARRIAIGARKTPKPQLSIETMIAIGGRRWQKNGMDRVYLNNWTDFAGINISRYNTGNISSASIDGYGSIANGRADRLLDAVTKVWFDATDGQLYCTHRDAREYEIRLLNGTREYIDLVARTFAGVKAAIAAL